MRAPTDRDDFQNASGHALVFDSGVGGLTVAQALKSISPAVHVDYSADTGYFPYGDKSDEELRRRLPAVAAALVEAGKPDVFVIACNTASTLALDEVRARLTVPVVGTVPAIKPAIAESDTNTVGLLATPGTIRRPYTQDLIDEFARDATVIKHGSQSLVALAEAVARGESPPLKAFAEAQAPLFSANGGDRMDTVVLACTHFPLVRAQLEASAPRPVRYVDSGDAIARQTARHLLAKRRPTLVDRRATAFVTSSVDELGGLPLTFKRFGFPHLQDVSVGVEATSTATVSSAGARR
ncbi:MAG: glutamate racemase [Pseudomonadota bacterium]